MASFMSRPALVTALALSFAVAACAGQPDASECPTGIVCPAGTKCAAVQQVCITNDCGDGITQTSLGEKCDDGNILDGDGCAANCLSTETCGDGVINTAADEICDDGNTAGGDGCAPDCRSVEVCGNGIRDVTEACDDGNTVPGDGCSGNCRSTEVCGNGVVDINEKCDDGSTPGGCNDDCQGGTGCGDGAIDKDGLGNPLEECDDGNTDNQDDCTNTCNLNTCGDGIVQISGARVEQCDPTVNFGETASCNLDCTTAACGDGKINNAAMEQCDAGLTNGDDRDCTAGCQLNVCGDGLRNQFGPNNLEQCDDGNAVQGDGCSNQCTTPDCGNGVLEMLEACDDDNTTNGDGCSSTCQFETCGDGVVNNGEACDPGPMIETASCNADCTLSACGDLRVNAAAGEECDDGNTMDDDFCRPPAAGPRACKRNVCGDGNRSPTEACDDGDTNNINGCSNACTQPSCGDGIKNGTDECDDGNTNNQDDCLNTCLLAECGDNVVRTTSTQAGGVEQCDDGAANHGPSRNCLATCRSNACGDGFRDQSNPQQEACDDGNTTTETSCPYGVQSCTLCNANCSAPLPLTGNVCGDGVVASPEACDDSNRVTETACPYGTQTCNTSCKDDCTQTLTLGGPFCGDGVVQATYEACDDRTPTDSCGKCSNGCGVESNPTAATAFIVAAPSASYNDNDRFTISDGFGNTVTFEFDAADDGVTMGTVRIAADTGDAGTMRGRIKNQINGSALLIDANDAGATGLILVHQRASALGNQPITDDVGTNDFYISASMSGGAARDCADGKACTDDDDCESRNCNGNVCEP